MISCDDIGKGYEWKQDSPAGFSRRFGSIGYDYGWNAKHSPFDDGIIIVGSRNNQIGGTSDLWAIKTDKYGLMEWEKTLGGSGNEEGYDVIATSDGGFLFVGYTWSFGNNQQIYVIKTDFHGVIEWDKTYGGGMWEVGHSVIEVNEGFVIAGFTNSPSLSSGNTDFYLVKIDFFGNLKWQKAYGNQAFPNHEWAYDIIETMDSGYIIVGGRDRYDKGSVNALVIRTDNLGNLIWEKEFLGENQTTETVFSISKSKSGKYYLCTSVNSEALPNKFQPKVIKMDGFGNIEWQRVLNSDSREYHQFRAITTFEEEVIVVGSSSKKLSIGHKEDAFLTKIDSNGNLIWTRPYGSSDKDDWGWSVFETPKSNLVFVGSTKSFGASLFDIYLVGTNPEGVSN